MIADVVQKTESEPKKAKRRGPPKKDQAKARPKLVAGVRFEKANEKQLDYSCHKLELPAGGTVEDKIRRVAAFFESQIKDGDQLDQCDVCGGLCMIEIVEPVMGEVCPYCGEGPEVEPKAKPANGAAEEPAELAVADSVEVVEGTQEELDDACKKVERLKLNLAKSFWQLGRAIAEIHERKLWQYRVTEADAQPLYTQFDQFVRAELGMTDDQAYKYMAVYEAFTEDDVKEVGVTKLSAVLKLPPGPMRDKLLAAARNGASSRDIRRGVQEAKDEENGTPQPDKITVALVMGTARFPMWKRKATGKKDAEKPEPARSAKDDAYCFELLPNGVTQTFRLVQKRSGQLELIVERVRSVE